MKNILALMVAISLVSLAACAPQREGMDVYSDSDVGKTTKIEFGRIISARKVKVQRNDTSGAGAVAGGVGGGFAGSTIGNGNGQVGATIGGALLGAIIGNAIEQNMHPDGAMEYIVTKQHGGTVSVVQNLEEGEAPLKVGQRVMVQIKGVSGKGSYMRVLPADGITPKYDTKAKSQKDTDDDDADGNN